MKRTLVALIAAGATFVALPGSAPARDAALIVVQSDYRNLPGGPDARPAVPISAALEEAGFEVSSSLDQDAEAVREAIEKFRADAGAADRLLVYLSGHMVAGARDSYLLTTEAETPTTVSVAAEGVAIGPILDILATRPGQAVLLSAASAADVAGEGLGDGLALEAPQGVTLLAGEPDQLLRTTREVLLAPGVPLGRGMERAPGGIRASGFVSDAVAFLPREDGLLVIEEPAPGTDDAFWTVAQVLDTVQGYELYLSEVEDGAHADEARALLAALKASGINTAQAAEDAIGLNRAARRQVQRNLSLLGHDPRGIDGIFGPATRAAIRDWQTATGLKATGYLTTDQLARMTTAADARAARIEARAEARKREEEARDRAYWNEVGGAATEASARAYLRRYPDGLFAEKAESKIAEVEKNREARATREERAFWQRAREEQSVAAFREYLARYPNGEFAEQARAAVVRLTNKPEQSAAIKAARAEERTVANNSVTRMLVETRLRALGYDLDAVDGTFDKTTRRALRRFQRAQGLEVTGFVTRATMVRLLM